MVRRTPFARDDPQMDGTDLLPQFPQVSTLLQFSHGTGGCPAGCALARELSIIVEFFQESSIDALAVGKP